MTFINDDGEVLDFDGSFAITKRAVSFFRSTILGDVSINFEVDNNSVNRKVLGYDGPQMLNQVAFTRQSFTLMRNGNPFMRGSLVIQTDNGPTLSCYFVSGNANWINLVQGLITELDYTGITNATNYTTQWTEANVDLSHFRTDSDTSFGITFPLVDWAYKGNKGNNWWFMSALQDIKNDYEYVFSDFYPCFYLRPLLKEIVQQSGLKVDGNILDDPLFNRLVITPKSGELKRDTINATTARGTPFGTAAGPVQITGFTETSDPEGCFASNVYTASRSSRVVITVTVLDASSGTPGCNGTVTIRKNGATFGAGLGFGVQSDGTGEGVHRYFKDGSNTIILTVISGDTIDLTLTQTGVPGTISVTCNLKIEIPTRLIVEDYITPDQFLPNIPCLDIIKFIVSYFGCSVYFEEASKTLLINIIEKLKAETSDNWSDYVQFKNGVANITSGYTITSARNNYIRLLPSDETPLSGYNSTHFQKYGEANLNTENTLKENNDLFIIPFAASGYNLGTNEFWTTNCQLINLVDQEPILYTSVSGGVTFNYPAGERFIKYLQVVRIVDDLKGDMGYYVCDSSLSATSSTYKGLTYIGTGTGKIYPQEIQYRETRPRLLVTTNQISVSNISSGTEIVFDDTFLNTGGIGRTEVQYAHFAKSVTGDGIDSVKTNAAPGNPDISTFQDPDVKTMYFNKIGSMIGNPTFKAMMLLPESVFQSFDFQRFIYLKTPNLTGYFYVESISNYENSATEVEVTLLML